MTKHEIKPDAVYKSKWNVWNLATNNCTMILATIPMIAPPELARLVSMPNMNSPPILPNMSPSILLNSSHNEAIFHVAIRKAKDRLMIPITQVAIRAARNSLPPLPYERNVNKCLLYKLWLPNSYCRSKWTLPQRRCPKSTTLQYRPVIG